MAQIKIIPWDGSSPPEESQLVTQLEQEGYKTHMWTDAPGTKYGDHKHAHIEVRWILKGQIKIGVGKDQFVLGPGDRLNMPAKTMHWAEVVSDAPVTYVCGEK